MVLEVSIVLCTKVKLIYRKMKVDMGLLNPENELYNGGNYRDTQVFSDLLRIGSQLSETVLSCSDNLHCISITRTEKLKAKLSGSLVLLIYFFQQISVFLTII